MAGNNPNRKPPQIDEPTTPNQLAMMARNEIEAQVEVARKYPRSIATFIDRASSVACLSRDIAESCMYALPRRDSEGKEISIVGPSVRLAEICANSWGNLHSGGRIVDEGDKFITAEGVAWDLETNNKVSLQHARRIVTSNGRRYGTDMIGMTGNAAIAIAHRNAVFKVIPRAFVDQLFDRVKETAVGNAQTLTKRRDEVFARLQKIGVHPDRIFARLGKQSIQDVTLDEVALLIALGTSIKEGVAQIDEAFPPPVVAVPTPPEGETGRVAVVNPGNAPPPVPSQAAQGAQVARTSDGAPATAQTQQGAATAPQNASAQVDDPGDIPEEELPPVVPQIDPEDQLILDKLEAAQSVADLSSVGSLIRTMKARIGNARYKVLFDAYTKASNRIKPAPAK